MSIIEYLRGIRVREYFFREGGNHHDDGYSREEIGLGTVVSGVSTFIEGLEIGGKVKVTRYANVNGRELEHKVEDKTLKVGEVLQVGERKYIGSGEKPSSLERRHPKGKFKIYNL